jgi:hypothetical protein
MFPQNEINAEHFLHSEQKLNVATILTQRKSMEKTHILHTSQLEHVSAFKQKQPRFF